MSSFRSTIQNTIALARYNMKIIFGGKFIYFILAAFIFFLVFGIIMALESSDMYIEEIYALLAFPAILLVFFPSVFGIQAMPISEPWRLYSAFPITVTKCGWFVT